MDRRNLVLGLGGFALIGLVFSGFSTRDFVAHLDRQVHSIQCSFVPGLADADATGASGCMATMMSPYSSIMRDASWGGIPISLPSMSVFAFLLFLAAELWFSERADDKRATGFAVLATALPALTSAVMAYISLATLGTACKMCVGIYIASAGGFVAALLLWRQASKGSLYDIADDDEITNPPASNGYLGALFALGVFFVAAPVLAYAASAPSHDAFITDCGVLNDPKDTYKVMVPIGEPNPDGVDAIEVLDPLCPACRAFEERLSTYARAGELNRKAVLFPLDNKCNWMIDSAIHPGACTVSEALICAGDDAASVMNWAFENQEAIRAAAKDDAKAAERMVEEAFPDLKRCVGSASARSKLNRSLRWTVRNRLQVLTPQFFVAGVKLCPEDLDLGFDYAMGHMLEGHAAGTLPKPPERPVFVRDTPPEPEKAPDAEAPEGDAEDTPEGEVDETADEATPTDGDAEPQSEEASPAVERAKELAEELAPDPVDEGDETDAPADPVVEEEVQ